MVNEENELTTDDPKPKRGRKAKVGPETVYVEKAPVELLRGPNSHLKPEVAEEDPPMDVGRLRDYRAHPTDFDTIRYAHELLSLCGPLVLDGVQYKPDGPGKIKAVPVEYLGLERQKQGEIEPVLL